jgi:hypothetical protein
MGHLAHHLVVDALKGLVLAQVPSLSYNRRDSYNGRIAYDKLEVNV